MDDAFDVGHLLGGRFRLVSKLGRGAVGNVWLAHDTLLHDERVACKVLNAAFAEDRRAIADLKREVLLTRKLRHPNIVSIHSFWDAQGARFITMEYVEGSNLAQLLASRDTPFTLADILPWLDQTCQALDHAHRQGVLHRDVKPANILLTKGGEALLADFGIARTAREARSRMTGHVTSGTLLFMSPEQLMGEPLDQRSDLYSLASTVYELLSGAPPFYKGAIVSQIQSKEPPPVPYCGEAVNRVLLKALRKNPDERYETCGAFFEALSAVAGYAPVTPHPPSFGPGDFALPCDTVDPNAETVTLPASSSAGTAKPLGALLVNAGLISEEQLIQALLKHDATRERLGALLVRMGYVAAEAVTEALRDQLRVKSVLLSATHFDPDVVALVPAELARKHLCVPMRREGERILVAMADPLDFDAVNALETRCGAPIEPRIATEADILSAIERVYRE